MLDSIVSVLPYIGFYCLGGHGFSKRTVNIAQLVHTLGFVNLAGPIPLTFKAVFVAKMFHDLSPRVFNFF